MKKYSSQKKRPARGAIRTRAQKSPPAREQKAPFCKNERYKEQQVSGLPPLAKEGFLLSLAAQTQKQNASKDLTGGSLVLQGNRSLTEAVGLHDAPSQLRTTDLKPKQMLPPPPPPPTFPIVGSPAPPQFQH